MKVAQATSAWEKWRIRQRKKRGLISWGSSYALALAVLGLLFWGGFAPLVTVGEKGEALSVKLGTPEGEDLPLLVQALPDPAMQAVLSAQRDSVRNTVEETRTADPDPGPTPVPVAPKKTVAPKPSSVKPTVAKTEPAKVPAPATPAPPVDAKPVDKPVITEKVIRGSEKGNSSELILKPQGDKISQNAYWPVYLFMPLPTHLDTALLTKVQSTKLYSVDERKALLLQFYSKTADGLVLTSEASLPVRPALWEIIEGAGYDVSNAEYKRGKNLNPVIINFKLGIPKSPIENPELSEVHLDQSSGNGPVDDAVLYAFQKSTFANGTGSVAQGRYTYDFTGKK